MTCGFSARVFFLCSKHRAFQKLHRKPRSREPPCTECCGRREIRTSSISSKSFITCNCALGWCQRSSTIQRRQRDFGMRRQIHATSFPEGVGRLRCRSLETEWPAIFGNCAQLSHLPIIQMIIRCTLGIIFLTNHRSVESRLRALRSFRQFPLSIVLLAGHVSQKLPGVAEA